MNKRALVNDLIAPPAGWINPATPTLNRIKEAKKNYERINGKPPTLIVIHSSLKKRILEEGNQTELELEVASVAGTFLGMRPFFTYDYMQNPIICAR